MKARTGHLYCQCKQGFKGPRCETEQWCTRTCHNGGTCIKDPSNPYQDTCRCPTNFFGRYCENKSRVPFPTCLYPQCEQRARDKVCDEPCNTHDCEWDGGDCSLSWPHPWENCTASVPCWSLFKNGRCDKECDNAGCLFDSFECQEAPSDICKYVALPLIQSLLFHIKKLVILTLLTITPFSQCSCFLRYDKYCKDHYGNGICDQSCYTEACGWDGLDCSGDVPASLADGTLIIVVLLQPKELLGDLNGFLRSLGALLRTNVQVKLNENKEPSVYPYYGVEKEQRQDGQRSRAKREMNREVIG